MADNESGGGSGWTAFIAGIILVAVIGLGVYAYTGGLQQEREVANMQIDMPDVKIDPPDVDLPDPPAVPAPPTADTAPAEAPATP